MRVIFMGTPEFAIPSLKALIDNGHEVVLVVTQPDKPKGRGKKVSMPPVKEFALEHSLEVYQPDKVKNAEFVDRLAELKPDVLVTAAYGKILSEDTLKIAPLGCVNVHASLLPKLRGAAPISWAIINGDSETGITTMLTDVGMDTGDILLKRVVPIDEDITMGELTEKLSLVGAELLIETLDKLKEGSIQSIPQDENLATYAPMISKKDALIDWNKAAWDIHNMIRGMNPWPCAYTYYEGNRMRIWKSKIANEDCNLNATNAEPGTILKVDKNGILVKTGDGILKIIDIQFDSAKRMPVANYILGHTIEEGLVLGEG